MTKWRDVTLGDVIELKRGYDLPNAVRVEGRYPIVSSSGVSGYHAEAKVKAPGVVTGRYGTLGHVFYVTEDFWPLNTSLYVKDFKGSEPRFVAALLESMDLAQHDGAAAVPGLNRNQLHTLPVRVPDAGGQRLIADVLGALDDLINNHRRSVEVLEEMTTAIYREWFVYRRYPGHEDVAGHSSPAGEIPTGWSVRSLEECAAALVDGDWVETKDQGGRDYRLLQVSNVGLGAFRETGKYRYISEDTFHRLNCTEVAVGDILISRMPEPVGRAWHVDHLDEPAVTVVDVALLTPTSKPMGVYLSQVLNSPEQLSHAATVATGTTRKRITRSVLAQSRVLVPDIELLERFSEQSAPARDMARRLRLARRALEGVRKLLLPRLVSGKLDLSVPSLNGSAGTVTA